MKYSASQVAWATGVDDVTIRAYINRFKLKLDAAGNGSKVRYTLADALIISLLGDARRRFGVSSPLMIAALNEAKPALSAFVEEEPSATPGPWLAVAEQVGILRDLDGLGTMLAQACANHELTHVPDVHLYELGMRLSYLKHRLAKGYTLEAGE